MTGLPEIATCSWTGYERQMGTAVRITLSAPRWIRLPDPRYSDQPKWPHIRELAPSREYFRAPPAEFRDRYLAQLADLAADIDRQLAAIPPEHGRLVLCCFEKDVSSDLACHRTMAARFLEQRHGISVPELGAGR